MQSCSADWLGELSPWDEGLHAYDIRGPRSIQWRWQGLYDGMQYKHNGFSYYEATERNAILPLNNFHKPSYGNPQ